MSEELRVNLLGMTLSQLQELCAEEGFPRFAAKQLCDWLYKKRVDSIDAMTNLSKVQRARLNEIACIGREYPVRCQVSKDGTKKYLFRVLDSHFIEAVYIPEDDRATLCVSCQVGCKMGCRFCVTGQQGFHGNLSAGDILNQLFSIPEFENLTNVVFMGMGEPMDNLDAVLAATQVLTSEWGLGWSPKRITVSTVGIIPGLKRFLDESQCHVAISMHTPLHEQRLQLMPAERQMTIAEVVTLLKQYDFTHQRRCSFEYVCFGGLNDSLAHGREILRLVDGLECRVNLIRFHEIPGVSLPGADILQMERLRDFLTARGVFTTIRASRGQDIFAACGLLSTAKKQQGL